MLLSVIISILLAFGFASARKCHDFNKVLAVTAENGVFYLTTPQSNVDVTNFVLNLSQQGHNYSQSLLQGYKTIAGDYNLSGTYCKPDQGRGNVLQILTHGI